MKMLGRKAFSIRGGAGQSCYSETAHQGRAATSGTSSAPNGARPPGRSPWMATDQYPGGVAQ